MIRYAYIIPFLPLASFLINIFFGKRLPRKGDWVSLATIATALVMAIGILIEVLQAFDPNFRYHVVYPWLSITDRFSLNVGILVDNVTAIMLVVVTLVSTLVHLYSVGYMHGDPRYNRFFAYLSIFSFSMLGLVLAESFFFMFVFWELVGLSSYLLIGFWFEKKSASDAGKKAFVVNRVGDYGFLVGIMIVFATCGVLGFDQVFEAIGAGKLSGSLLTFAGIGIFCGAIGKSAQFPLHVWLPDAMEGPTPVSALIHAATMVAAGVYLVGRVFPMFTPDAFLVIAYFGLITLFISATIALTQNDIKKVLAYSTCSQLGFMVLGLGVGGYTAGLAHLTTHAAFKACLFLGSGSVIHAVHSQDIQEMGGLRKKMPITFYTFLIATLAIAGVPLFSGFYSKDMILAAALEFGMRNPQHYPLFFITLLTAGMTAFYMFRMVILTFFGTPRDHHKYDHAHESPPNMTIPLIILAVLSFSIWFEPWFGKLVVKPKTVASVAAVSAAHAPEPAAPAAHEAAPPAAAPAAQEAAPPAPAPAEHAAPASVEHAAPAHAEAHDAAHDEHLAHTAHTYAMYSSVAVGALGILLAFGIYMFGWVDPKATAERFQGLYNFSLNKWYFDELYEATVINGSKAFSRGCAWFDNNVVDGLVNLTAQLGVFLSFLVGKFDNGVIDGAVNGVADVTIGSGSILRRIQTGKLYHYVFILAGGALVIFLLRAL
ncbi:MAG: NADH-quinone oxidoreductase subunit L [Thermodesulfobacteriota bacterium]